MTDFLFMDKTAEMIRSQNLPRLLYKNGITADGTFTPYMNISDYTSADIFTDTEAEFPVRVRFSKVFGDDGASDTARDVAGMSVRFFSKSGHFDLIGHSIDLPHSLRTPENIVSLIKLFSEYKEDREFNESFLWERTADSKDGAELVPFLTKYFSDDATIKSYRSIEGNVLNDYVFVDKFGNKRLVSFKWEPQYGIKNIRKSEAEFLAGYDPSAAKRDLALAIREKKYPKFTLTATVENIELSGGNGRLEGAGLSNGGSVSDHAEPEQLVLGEIELNALVSRRDNDSIAFTPSNTIGGIELRDTDFNRFTAFAFNESARFRGGVR